MATKGSFWIKKRLSPPAADRVVGMGIRFYCPNGHKLHVKSFLAGKRGICPHCDSRFDIPHESQIPEDAPKVRPLGEQPIKTAEATLGETTADAPRPHTAVAAPPAVVDDPISESPDSVWYVRPPAGGQFGPARGDVLRQWIAEGRVSADSMVWREGWPDWLSAGEVLPGLVHAATAQPADVTADQATEPLPSSDVTIAEDPSRARLRGTTARGRGKSIAAVVFLFLLIIVLVVVLIVVVGREQTAAADLTRAFLLAAWPQVES